MSSKRAVVFGGTGGIGSAVVRGLLDASGRDGTDWRVDVVARSGGPRAADLEARGASVRSGDRRDTAVLRDLLRSGADLVVDTVCATRDDAAQLLPFLSDVGSTVMISSRAVYVDEQGRHANSLDKPVFGGPVTELQPTVPAGDGDPTSRDGYAANKVAAEQLLLDDGAPVTVLRPSKAYGVGIGRPREWFVVRRALDGRERIALADAGRSVDHTTSADGLADLVRLVADAPGRRILNVGDDPAPSVLEIVRTVADRMDHAFDVELLTEDAPPFLGLTPWTTPHPFVLDLSAARALGWTPRTYADAVLPEVDWLRETALATPAGADVPWAADPFWERSFDYGPEDAALTLLALRG
jgi:nucleoside-diphosphate-sugar epimerase